MGEAWSLKDTCASGEVSPQRQEDRQKLRARELTHTRCTLTASERSSPCYSNSECFLWNVCFTCGRRVGKVLRALGRMAWRWGLCLEGSGNPCWKVHEWSRPAEGFIPHQGDYPCSQSWNLVVAQFLRLMDSFK